jgi:hypothetical protein
LSKIPISFVHHANQLIITNGYDNRDGISEICAGYNGVLELHEKYGIPTSLHLSGTLVEAARWHEPEFLDRVRKLLTSGICGLIGGTYAEPIMPMLSTAMNRRQLELMGELIAEHFPKAVDTVRTAWLPERVWSPELHRVLTDQSLPSGPFARVLVDDRLLARPASRHTHGRDSRAAADLRGPFGWTLGSPPRYRAGMVDPGLLRPQTVADPAPLTMVPISAHLRYLCPPHSAADFEFLHAFLSDLAERYDPANPMLLVYADDLEKTAGVGGWEPAIERYERLLTWLGDCDLVEAVELDDWLDRHPAPRRDVVHAGAYYELEIDWLAHVDYRGWHGDPQWQPYRELLADVERELAEARTRVPAPDENLVTLAERLLLLGQHETAWRDPADGTAVRALAPWVRATASHARLARPLLAAAHWAAGPRQHPSAGLLDVDGDGVQELILAGDEFWCLVSPQHGARVVMLVHRAQGERDADSALIVGNPADHWNFQEELHRFMDVPAGHPGALADRHAPHQPWVPHTVVDLPDGVAVELRPAHGDHSGPRRRYALVRGIPGLVACLHTAEPGHRIDSLLVPDYLDALRRGQEGVTDFAGERHTGWRTEDRGCWLGFDPEQVALVHAGPDVAGHGYTARLSLVGAHADVIIGTGPADDTAVAAWLAAAGVALHETTGADRACGY